MSLRKELRLFSLAILLCCQTLGVKNSLPNIFNWVGVTHLSSVVYGDQNVMVIKIIKIVCKKNCRRESSFLYGKLAVIACFEFSIVECMLPMNG